MATSLKGPWAIAVAFIATAGAAAGVFFLEQHLKEISAPISGDCTSAYYADGADCRAKDKDGNAISIDINTPETPRP